MIERFGERDLIQLTNRPNSGPLPAAIDQERLDSALQDAYNLINGYLGKVYPLPLNPVPSLVVRWSCDLARWFLQPGTPPEMVKTNYERTLVELREASEGKMSLGLEEADNNGPWSGAAEIVTPKRKFTDKSWY
jgi:phage gp36-like protein